jgi:hypothetical protein
VADPNQSSDGSDISPPSQEWTILRELRTWLSVPNFTFLLILIVIGAIVVAVLWDFAVIRRLGDPGFARGLITFLITVATIGLAFVLVLQSLSAVQSPDDSFRRAREIFAGLMGVLGTIVGFYFGSAEKPVVPVEIAQIKVADKQLLTHVSGGTRPYAYSITSSDRDFRQIKKVSEDGWIIELLEQPPKPGSTITVEVTDNKEQQASRKIVFPGELKPEGTSPTPKPPETTPQPTGTQEPGKPAG